MSFSEFRDDGVTFPCTGTAIFRCQQTSGFSPKSRRFRDRDALIRFLAEHPEAGALLRGSGGIRKLRWAQSGRGKRGSIRVIYYYRSEAMPVYLLGIFAKNQKENLSTAEKNALAKLVEQLVATWRQGNE